MSIGSQSILVHQDGVSSLKYDATESKRRRASAKIYSGSEDTILDTANRWRAAVTPKLRIGASRASALPQSFTPLDTSDQSLVSVKMSNTMSNTLSRFSIVGIGAPQITPSTNLDAF